jgi:hypothetical protein
VVSNAAPVFVALIYHWDRSMRRLSSARLNQPCCTGTIALLTALLGNIGWADRAMAQLPTCLPPSGSEYLLLAVTPNADAQARVTAILPTSYPTKSCDYLGEAVLRVGGFATQETANAWASYVANQAKVSAFVAKPTIAGQAPGLTPLPPASPPSLLPPNPGPTAPATPTAIAPPASQYNPQPLGSGYAVLVNYYNKPETATLVRQTAGQVGLVSYGQKPYLLASFTSDQSAANVLLQALTDKGMWAMVVDGRRVVMLKPSVGQ